MLLLKIYPKEYNYDPFKGVPTKGSYHFTGKFIFDTFILVPCQYSPKQDDDEN